MATKFILVETNFAYNDEFYYPESGTTPKVVFDSEEEALKECAKLNKEAREKYDHIYDEYNVERYENDYGEIMPDKYAVIEVEAR